MMMPTPLQIGPYTARLPVIQGGMGVRISLSGLASAVAEEGGVGVIATAGIGMQESDYLSNFLEANKRALRDEIRKVREATKGLLGVNILVPLSNYADMARTAIEEKVEFIFSGAALPLNLPSFLDGSTTTKLVPIVSSARAAKIVIRKWLDRYRYRPDAIVVEGPKAGGHLGFKEEDLDDPAFALEALLEPVLREAEAAGKENGRSVPVIAAGGIYTGEDVYAAMAAGASGVQMATRFVTTAECDAAEGFKQTYIDAGREDMVIIKSPVGLPGRAIRNEFLDQVEAGKRTPFKCPYHCLVSCDYQKSPYCIALALMNAVKARMKLGFAFAGANAYRAEKMSTVKEVVNSLLEGYARAFSAAVSGESLGPSPAL
jgi:NAD(P)H-dependent flavin oxidoreductase YrpB (nitropropane dioxygenase family)